MAKLKPQIILFIALVFSITISFQKNKKLNIIETKVDELEFLPIN